MGGKDEVFLTQQKDTITAIQYEQIMDGLLATQKTAVEFEVHMAWKPQDYCPCLHFSDREACMCELIPKCVPQCTICVNHKMICGHPYNMYTKKAAKECRQFQPLCSSSCPEKRSAKSCVKCKDKRICSPCTFSRCDATTKKRVKKEFIQTLARELQPTLRHDITGKCAALEVKTEGSVPDGIEVPTVAQRINFGLMKNNFESIINTLSNHGCTLSPRCSTHIHYLLAYYDNGQTEYNEMGFTIPSIVLKNFYQLHRSFTDVLIWLTSAVDITHITRWQKHRNFQTLIGVNGTLNRKTFGSIQQHMARHEGKYSFLNINNVQMDETGNIVKLHVEARYPDGIFSPSVLSAFCVLVSAMMMKSVSLSRYGLVETREMNNVNHLANSLVAGGDWEHRASQPHLNTKDRKKVIDRSKYFVNFLKAEILSLSEEAYNILFSLCETPVHSHFTSWKNQDWRAVEKFYKQKNQEHDEVITAIIETNQVTAETPKKWFAEVSAHSGLPARTIETYVSSRRELLWDGSVGQFLSLKR